MTDYLDRGGREIKREVKTTGGELVLYGRDGGPMHLTLWVNGGTPTLIRRFEYWEHIAANEMFERLSVFAGVEQEAAA